MNMDNYVHNKTKISPISLSSFTEPLEAYECENIGTLDPNTLLIPQVFDHYYQTMKTSSLAWRYCQERKLDDPAVIDAFHLGFADRTLGLRLPANNTQSGGAIRGYLQRKNLLLPSGHELFRFSLVFPIYDEQGCIVNAYGRKISKEHRSETIIHATFNHPTVGLFNHEAIASNKSIILCKSPLEALTFWCAGFRNVVSTLGLRCFSEDHLKLFERQGTDRVYIAYDNTPLGNRTARLVAQVLSASNIDDCRRVVFPVGMDANAYAVCNESPADALAECLYAAQPCYQSYEHLITDLKCD